MSLRVVAFVFSRLQFAVTAVLGLPFLFALYLGESCAMDFAGTILCSLMLAIVLNSYGALEHDNLTVREGIAITCIAWLIIPIVGALPFLSSHVLGVVDSLFEGFSGLTCTGATVLSHLDAVPRSLILWRGLMHWLGGLGIIVIFIALFPQPGSGIMRMFSAEGSGIAEARLLPRIRDMAGGLLTIYVGLSLLCLTMLLLCGLELFDAVTIAMSAIATGGFAPLDGSIGAYHSLPVELVLIVFMLVGGGNFGLYFLGWKKGYHHIWRNTEWRVYIALFAVTAVLAALNLQHEQGIPLWTSLRAAGFQMAAIITTTGLDTVNFDTWPAFAKFCIVLLMLTGGCAGSTSGGMKLARVIILCKMVGMIVQEKLHPNSVAHVSLADQDKSRTAVYRVARFFFLYISLAMLAAFCFNFDGLPVVDSFMLGVSCMGNVGVAFGAAHEFHTLPDVTKLISCLCMVIGRLEIFTFLAILQPGFWRRNSNW